MFGIMKKFRAYILSLTQNAYYTTNDKDGKARKKG